MYKKRKNKKLVSVVISLLVAIPAVIIIFVLLNFNPNKMKPESINSVVVTSPAEEEFKYTDLNDLKLYADIYTTAEIIDTPASQGGKYKIFKLFIDRKSDDISCEIMLSESPDDCLLKTVSKDKTTYRIIKSEYASKLLMHDDFSAAYTYYIPPTATVSLQGETSKLSPSQMEWNYRKSDGLFYKTDTTEFISDEVIGYDYTPEERIILDFELVPDAISVQIFDGADSVFSGMYDSSLFREFSYERRADLKYVFTAEWFETSSAKYHGKAVYIINADYIVEPSKTISSSKIRQGEFSVFTIGKTADSETLTVRDENLLIYKDSNANHLFYPAYIGGDVGQKNLIVDCSKSGEVSSFVEITPLEDTDDVYQLPESENKNRYVIDYTDNTAQINILLAYTNQKEPKLWQGEFSSPMDQAEILLDYGTTVASHGQDIQQATELDKSQFLLLKSESCEVKSIGDGKVVYAGENPLYGNVMLVNHGLGVFSLYANLERFYAAEGETVAKDTKIATVFEGQNQTLQFGVIVNRYLVNPSLLNHCMQLAGLI